MVPMVVYVNNTTGSSSSTTEKLELDNCTLKGDVFVLGRRTVGSSPPVMKREACALNGTYSFSVSSITGSSTLEKKSVV
jgi:hypothetical protein